MGSYGTWGGRPIAGAPDVGWYVGASQEFAATGRPVALRLGVFITFRDGLMAGERFH